MFRLDFSLTTLDFIDDTGLFELPGVLRCEIRRIDGSRPAFEAGENYSARRAGSDFALEAELAIPGAPKENWKTLRIGYPLSELLPGDALSWQFDGHALQLFRNGKLLNEDFVCAEVETTPRLSSDPPHRAVANLRFAAPLFRRGAGYPQTVAAPIHLWDPPYFNAWVGDTSTFTRTRQGEYHLFYLFDRRHHAGKAGCGGHYWARLVSRDLKHWRDDGMIIEPENPSQTFGTGTPFELNGELAIAYGLHTSRLSDRTMTPMLRERTEADGTIFRECDFSDGNGLLPEGATYAVAADGDHFRTTHKLFHWTQNPSVFRMPDGRYRLFCGYDETSGIWDAEEWGVWKKIRSGFPPAGKNSFSGNNLDCPNYFEWGGTYYLLVGFSGMWMAQDENFLHAIDLAERGEDLYDGLYVPMVSPHPENPERRILAAWLPVSGCWGGVLGMRELVRHSDGILSCRWLAECMPSAGEAVPEVPGSGSFYYETKLAGNSVIRFEGEGRSVEFRLDPERRKAQLCYADIPELPTTRERAMNPGQFPCPGGSGFAIGFLRLPGGPVPVRLLVRYRRKWQGTVIDTEIAGCRTLIFFFAGVKVNHLSGGTGGTIRPLLSEDD